MNKLYIHIFSFYVQASSIGLKYVIDDVITLDEKKYRNMILGMCLKNMGLDYNNKEFRLFYRIKRKLNNSRFKVGRVCTRIENISKEEISTILSNLGYMMPSIYLKEEELTFLYNIQDENEEITEPIKKVEKTNNTGTKEKSNEMDKAVLDDIEDLLKD